MSRKPTLKRYKMLWEAIKIQKWFIVLSLLALAVFVSVSVKPLILGEASFLLVLGAFIHGWNIAVQGMFVLRTYEQLFRGE